MKQEMMDIISDKEKLIKSLRELEFEFAQGNISKSAYNLQKKDLNNKLETLAVADRVKRLQGKGENEKPLDYWTDKKNEEKAAEEKEELMQKYMTSSKPRDLNKATVKKGGMNRNRAVITAFVALIFLTGIGFGFLVLNGSSESAAVSMQVNQSAFPTVHNNTTNITNDTTLITNSNDTSTDNGNTGGTGGNNGGSGGSGGNGTQ